MGFADALQDETRLDQEVHPLAQGAREERDAELSQAPPNLRRSRRERPLLYLAVATAEVVAHFDGVGQPVFATKVPAVRRVEAGVGDGELQEPARLYHRNASLSARPTSGMSIR